MSERCSYRLLYLTDTTPQDIQDEARDALQGRSVASLLIPPDHKWMQVGERCCYDEGHSGEHADTLGRTWAAQHGPGPEPEGSAGSGGVGGEWRDV